MRKYECFIELYNGGSYSVVVEAYTDDHAMDRAEAWAFANHNLSSESILSVLARKV